ncbi:hypothetical protein C2845_PM17G14210 [Panicum miliaceum]|uniref:Uncharacterized protein n=1 Tax=Panicum miliaceum TaxID=4540 RepID=A0A3L6Q4H3_PANMI|nr:hypothetical protein C2845_PM17G14210 [Panicum miliaceum]
MQRLEEVIAQLEARCREPLKIMWEEPLGLAAFLTPNWEAAQGAGASSGFAEPPSEVDLEDNLHAVLATSLVN